MRNKSCRCRDSKEHFPRGSSRNWLWGETRLGGHAPDTLAGSLKVSHLWLNSWRSAWAVIPPLKSKNVRMNEYEPSTDVCLSAAGGWGLSPTLALRTSPAHSLSLRGRDQILQDSVLAEVLLTRLLIGQTAAPPSLTGRRWQLPLTPRIPCLFLALPSPAHSSTV